MIFSRRLAIALSLTVFNLGALAQNKVLRLALTEQGSETPIIGANVVYSANGSTDRLAITDLDGHADLALPTPAPDSISYVITSVGFVTLRGKASTRSALQLLMSPDVLNLSDVVVTGSRAPRPIKLSPVSTQVIGGKQLVEAGYASLQQALQQETPGLNIQKVGFGNEISMQGLDARHVLFLMDGERMTGEMAGNLDYERFNLHAIDRIEVVKGASSTLYGSRASGAVINLITKRTSKNLDIQAGARWAAPNERNYPDASPSDFLYMFEKNADRPNLQSWVSAGVRMGRKFTSQTDILYSSSDAFYMYQASEDTKTYTAEANSWLDHDVTIKSESNRPPTGIEGSEHVSVQQKFFLDDVHGFGAQLYGSWFFMNTYDLIQDMTFNQSRDYTVGFKAHYDCRDWFRVSLSLHGDFYDRFKRHERIDTRQKVYDSRILQPRLSISSGFFTGHDIIFGVEHTSDDLTSDRFNGDASHTMQSRSLRETEYFLQDEWSLSSLWTLSVGVRTNFSRAFGLMAMPKVAAKFTPSDFWTLRANYSMGYRSPSIKELFFNWDNLGMFMIKGNEYLNPEKNNYFSLGAEWSDDNLFLSANAYANLFRNKIEGVWRVYDMQYNFEYTNLSHQSLLGVEAILKWRFLNDFTLSGTYSFVNISKLSGVQVSSTSPHAATANFNYRLRRKKYSLSATLSASFMGRKRFDIQDRLTIDGQSREAYFRTNLPPYALCNVSVSQTLFNSLKVSAGVDNLFNYVPKTLGSGVTMFNVPATPGARAHVQLEILIDQIVNTARQRKNSSR